MSTLLFIEVPDCVAEAIEEYLQMRPDYSLDRVATAGLSLFLLQNLPDGNIFHSRQMARAYLDSLFKKEFLDAAKENSGGQHHSHGSDAKGKVGRKRQPRRARALKGA